MIGHGIHPRLMKPPKTPHVAHVRHEKIGGVTVPKRLVLRDKEKEYKNAIKQGKI